MQIGQRNILNQNFTKTGKNGSTVSHTVDIAGDAANASKASSWQITKADGTAKTVNTSVNVQNGVISGTGPRGGTFQLGPDADNPNGSTLSFTLPDGTTKTKDLPVAMAKILETLLNRWGIGQG